MKPTVLFFGVTIVCALLGVVGLVSPKAGLITEVQAGQVQDY
jgi:hypothetical protein